MIELVFLIGVLLVFGFAAMLFFERTGISEILILMAAGIMLGPIFGVIDVSAGSVLAGAAGFMTVLALILMLFDGGLTFEISGIVRAMPVAFAFTTLTFLANMGLIAAVAHYLFSMPLLAALLLGAALSGTASSNVIPMMARSHASERTKAILAIESTITDAFTLIIGLAVLDMMVGNGDLSGAPAKLMGSITSAAFIGMILSGLWLGILRRLPTIKYSYMLTLATVFVAYSLSEFFGGNGVIAVFVFGLILGNSERIASLFKLNKKQYGLDPEIRRMQEEISFLVRTFFFVYLGLLMVGSTFKETAVLLSAAIVVVSLAARWLSVRAFSSSIQQNERNLVMTMMPRGLAAAVLVTIPASKGITIPFFSETIIISILLTNIVATAGLFLFKQPASTLTGTKAETAAKPRIIRTK